MLTPIQLLCFGILFHVLEHRPNAYIDAEAINFNHGANLSNCTRLGKLHFLSKSQNKLLNFHFYLISVKMQYLST